MKSDENGKATVRYNPDIPFAISLEDEEADVALFVRRVTTQLLPTTLDDARYLESGHLGIETCLMLSQRAFERLALLWAGLLPEQQRAYEDRLADFWQEFRAMRDANAALAERMLAERRKTNGNGNG
jgi:hypothetical protein